MNSEPNLLDSSHLLPPPQDLKVLEVSVEEIRSGVIIKKNKISTQERKTKKSKL